MRLSVTGSHVFKRIGTVMLFVMISVGPFEPFELAEPPLPVPPLAAPLLPPATEFIYAWSWETNAFNELISPASEAASPFGSSFVIGLSSEYE